MFIWTSFIDLPWWAMTLWTVYTFYFIIRTIMIWSATNDEGLVEGYKEVFLGRDGKTLRLYHVVRMLLDIPPSILGLLFPIIKAVFKVKLYEFKDGDK